MKTRASALLRLVSLLAGGTACSPDRDAAASLGARAAEAGETADGADATPPSDATFAPADGADATPPSTDAGRRGTCTAALAPEDCGDLSTFLITPELPPSRGNASADADSAALLGFRVFFDARFSKNGAVRCESCHSVDHAFADAEAVPTKGLGSGHRNAPTVLNAARYRMTFWDGRVDSLWSQPLLAFENPDEMGMSRLETVHLVQTLYSREYAKAFGPLRDFTDAARFPPAGKPGDAAFDRLPWDDQLEVNRVVANLGKAIEAYERKLAAGPSRVDRYLAGHLGVDAGYGAPTPYSAGYGASKDGGAETLTETERRGFAAFINAGCPACHAGPDFTDNALHVIGVPKKVGEEPDPGLTDSDVAALEASPFNAAGPFFAGGPVAVAAPTPVLGAFRTPSLRNVRATAPYGHNGAFATLREIVDFHLRGGGQDSSTFAGRIDPKLLPRELGTEDRDALIDFLEALDGDYPALPWGQWPNGNG